MRPGSHLIHPRCQAKAKHGDRCQVRTTTYRGIYELCWAHGRVYDEYGQLEVYVSRMMKDEETTIIRPPKSSKLTNT